MPGLYTLIMKKRSLPCMLALIFMVLSFMWPGKIVWAQRIYANSQVSDMGCILISCGSLTGAANPVTTASINAGTPSVLTAPLVVSSSFQTLNFGVAPPMLASNTPVTIKVKTTTVLNLASMISIQAVNGTTLVAPATSGTNLIALLNASDIVEYTYTPSAAYTGTRVTTGGIVGLASSASIYYAFYIAPPTVSTQVICAGQTATVSITNPQTNLQGNKYYYQWYTAASGGTLVKNSQDTFLSAVLLSTTDYYVAAVDSNVQTAYSSARRKVTVSVNPFPSANIITPTYICQGAGVFKINYSNPVNSPDMYSVAWGNLATNEGFADLGYTSLSSSPLNIAMPVTAPVATYDGVLLLRNTNNCVNTYPFSLIVQHPPDPHATTTFQ